MKSSRKDYNLARNQEIYTEYLSTDTSYNILAKKYNLAPQRIQSIIKTAKSKDMSQRLLTNDTKEKRESYKNSAVEARERGKLNDSLMMFESVVEWDIKNKNNVGLADVYGHLALTHQKIAQNSKDKMSKVMNLEKAEEYLTKALELFPNSGSSNISKVHLSKNMLLRSEYLTENEKQIAIKSALETINSALVNFPGSESAKAWPLNVKMQILIAMGKYDEAFSIGLDAEDKIYKGYFTEIDPKTKNDNTTNDQAIMKLNIWLAGIFNSMAIICKSTNRYALARFYANAVIKMQDDDGNYKMVKERAKSILEGL